MTRAEEKAVEYQIRTYGPNVKGGASMLSEEEYMRFNMNLDFKNGYEQAEKDTREIIASCRMKNWREGYDDGYKQAEQDLALTWEDLQTINDLFYQVDAENSAARDDDLIEQDLPFPYGQPFYEEVLRRFREMKHK